MNWGQAAVAGVIGGITNVASFGLSNLVQGALIKSGEALAPVGIVLIKMAKSILPKYTPAASWAFQTVMGWLFPFFSSIPGLIGK